MRGFAFQFRFLPKFTPISGKLNMFKFPIHKTNRTFHAKNRTVHIKSEIIIPRSMYFC
jgi:hypothetical protein